MKIENQTEKFQEEALELLEKAENKSEAIVQVIQMAQEAKYEEIINELKKEEEKAKSDEQYAKSLNLRILNAEEKEFYQKLKDAKQAVTFKQDDIIPTTIIDRTLDELQKESKIMDLISFAPANVTKWITGSYTGVASWHGLTDELKGELEASISSLNVEDADLDAYLVIPKAISDLSLPFVDKFFNAILKEALMLGIEDGYCNGNGQDEPIGIYKSIDKSIDGVHQDKDINTDLTSFKPKAMANAKKYLTKNGKRKYDKIYIVCHPNDEADYVAPAIYNDRGELVASYKNLEVVTSVKNPQGKAALVLPKKYTMGFSGFKVKKYDQTLALKNADLLVGNVYANGQADDDYVAYVFDVTKLEEYVPTVKTIEVVPGV
ncbi:MAG: phage major capsid protein [Clostridia bacterium]|jgi:HK97 family phage major capsid protein|nr:phage major capsid protein [Clostridia bacterium]